MDSLVFPNFSNRIKSFFLTYLDIVKTACGVSFEAEKLDGSIVEKNNKQISSRSCLSDPLDLFQRPSSYQNFTSSIKQCAVDEFEYDFTNSNPFNWDLQNLVFENQHTSNDNDSPSYASYPKFIKTQTSNKTQRQFQHEHHQHQVGQKNQTNQDGQYGQPIEHSEHQANHEFHQQHHQVSNNDLNYSPYAYQRQNHSHSLSQLSVHNVEVNVVFSSDEEDDYESDNDDLALALDDELTMNYARIGRPLILSNVPNQAINHTVSPIHDVKLSLEQQEKQITSENKINAPIVPHQEPTPAIGNPTRKSLILDSASTLTSASSPTPRPVQLSSLTDKKLILHSSSNNQFSSLENLVSTSESSSEHSISHEVEEENDELLLINTQSRKRQRKVLTCVSSSSDNLYKCSICSTNFKVKGYLTRHMKKHFVDKPFHCPFYAADSESKCHPSGGFSRRDTFKTHLKALHFVYPTGTKSGDRSDKSGRCAGCFIEFVTNKDWLESHIMTNKCKGMISEYK